MHKIRTRQSYSELNAAINVKVKSQVNLMSKSTYTLYVDKVSYINPVYDDISFRLDSTL